MDIRALYKHVMDRFAAISQIKIDDNLARFNKGIDLTVTLVVYTRKQELCQETANNESVPISETTMITTRTKYTVSIIGMEVAWRGWMRTAQAGRSWLVWKQHWI